MEMGKFNTIWVTGSPRTGSMWTVNVIREIFLSRLFDVYPREQLKDDREWLNFFRDTAVADTKLSRKYVLKTHALLNPSLPKSKFIINARNPYEICASFYEFMQCDLDQAIAVASKHQEVIMHYSREKTDRVFVLNYSSLELNAVNVILALSKFVECEIESETAQKIRSKFSKKAIRVLVENNEKVITRKLKRQEPVDKRSIVGNPQKTFRSFDLRTGFQSNHISNRESGVWKKSFSQDQINLIIEALDGTATDLGYETERLQCR